jgi:hypothetical protein
LVEPADSEMERTEIWHGMDNINSRTVEILYNIKYELDVCIGKEIPYVLLTIEQLHTATHAIAFVF